MNQKKSIFNRESQQKDLTGKIVVGLERISEAFRVLLWEQGKMHGLSPIQIQILIFIKYHPDHLCGVSYLAKEFNMTKPTISDTVKSLNSKELISKRKGGMDSRSQVISLTEKGLDMVSKIENFAQPITKKVASLNHDEQSSLLSGILSIIHQLNQSGIISVQRTCYACKFYQKTSDNHYCNLLKSNLKNHELRVDCPEFEARA